MTQTKYDNDNIFAKILKGDIPCDKVFEDDHVLAFNDIAPQAPVHILVIPKKAYISIDDFGEKAEPEESKAMFSAIHKIVKEKGLQNSGFRVIANTGKEGGQEVPHFHMHIIGGAPCGPMLAKNR